MKTPEHQLRQVLESVRYPVNPQHEAAFLQMLLQDKRDRKVRGWFFLAALLTLLLAGSIFAYLALRTSSMPETQDGQPESEVSQFRGKRATDPSAESGTLLPAQPTDTDDLPSGQHVSDEVEAKDGHHDVNTSEMHPSQNSTSAASTESDQPASGHRAVASTLSPSGLAPDALHTGQTEGGVTKQTAGTIRTDIADPSMADEVQRASTTSSRLVWADLASLPSTALFIAFTRQQVALQSVPIIPAHRLLSSRRVHYGLSGIAHLSGQLFHGSAVPTGIGIQAGGYGTYRLSPFTMIRMDAGFSMIDGGFLFMKESESEVYGFSSTVYKNTLQADRLYGIYAGLEGGLIRGKNTFTLGLQGQYTYGARGTIEVLEHPADAPVPVSTSTENTWLVTSGLPKLSVAATAGIRTPLTRRIELGAMLRIPVLHAVRSPDQQDQYRFSVRTPGIAPQLMLSYQINQR